MSFPPVEPTRRTAPPGPGRPYGGPPYGGPADGRSGYGRPGYEERGYGDPSYGEPAWGGPPEDGPPPGHRQDRRRQPAGGGRRFRPARVIVTVAVAVVVVLAGVVAYNHFSSAANGGPSGVPVPTGDISGWHLTYSTDFSGKTLPSGWDAYSGQPGGDNFGYWDPKNVTVSGGELHLRTTANDDPQRPGTYSTGGVAFDGNTQSYGMYLVRMKGDSEPGVQISNIALLWPENNKSWPPEIDFYEDEGASRSGYTASLHPGPNGDDCCIIRHSRSNTGTQWHTYGVTWTPTSLSYSIDGTTWATVPRSAVSSPAQWPDDPMTLDLQSQNLGAAQPSHPLETMTVAWVAEYAPKS